MADADPLAVYRSGSTEPWTVDVLCALVRALRPSILIETGTFEARTTLRLAEACQSYRQEKSARLYTVEFDGERAKAASTVLAGVDGVVGIQGDAIAFLRSLTDVADFIFLDDDHGMDHVREEIRVALPALRPGGVICVHDVMGPFGLAEVVRENGGIVLDLPRLHLAGGLGIITK